MTRYVENIPEKPDGRKHGLRMIIRGFVVDENDVVKQVDVEYSTYHGWGSAWLFLGDRNPFDLKRELEEGL